MYGSTVLTVQLTTLPAASVPRVYSREALSAVDESRWGGRGSAVQRRVREAGGPHAARRRSHSVVTPSSSWRQTSSSTDMQILYGPN